MRRLPLRLGLLLLAVLVGPLLPFALGGALARYPVLPGGGAAPWVKGAYHVHTRHSDGWGTVEEVAHAAREAGLSFVVLTDHNVPQPQEPRWVEGVLVVPQVELSTDSGHLVALGASGPLAEVHEKGVDAVAVVERAGGMAVLAHPVQRKNPWRDWQGAQRAGGYELYSGDTLFRDALAAPFSRLVPALGGWLGHRVHGVLALVDAQEGPHARLLELGHAPVALCAQDAHGYPPYADVFRAMSMVLPTERLPTDASEAAGVVLSALREGRAVCAFQGLGEPAGFALEGVGPGRRARVGQAVRVVLPPGSEGRAQVRVWGGARLEADGRTVRLEKAGPVHLEVWVEAPALLWGTTWRPWLVPSPLEVVP